MCTPLSLPERLLEPAKTLNPAPALIETAGWKSKGEQRQGCGAPLWLPNALNTFPKPGSHRHGSWLLQPTPSGESQPLGSSAGQYERANLSAPTQPGAVSRNTRSGKIMPMTPQMEGGTRVGDSNTSVMYSQSLWQMAYSKVSRLPAHAGPSNPEMVSREPSEGE